MWHSLRAFLDHPLIGPVVAAVPDPAEASAALGPVDPRVQLVTGGSTRQASVRAALGALPDVDLILVHDAARPFAGRILIDAVIEGARRHGAAVPGVPVPDTVKRLARSRGLVDTTMPREDLVLAQTPQGFRADLLRRAHDAAERAAIEGPDDAMLVERLGEPVAVVPGHRLNIKITSPEDWGLAEAILRSGSGGAHRG